MIGEKIVLLRKKLGKTQDELAKHLGSTRQSVSFYESGKRNPDPNTINAIADFFGCSTDYLLGRTEIVFPPEDYSENVSFVELAREMRNDGLTAEEIRDVWKKVSEIIKVGKK